MGKKLRFPLKMEDEIEVRTLNELKDNFSLTKVLDYVSDGKLITWLRDRFEDGIADAIEKLDSNCNEFPKQICEAFGINNVAFCQDDLYDLLDEQYDTIYLYGDKFEIPINRHNITYIGFNNPIVIVNSEDEVNWKEKKISLSKVQFDDKYKKLLKYKKFISQFRLTEEIQRTEVYTMYIEKIMEKIYDVAANRLSKEGLETLKDMLETYKYDETPDYIINVVAGVVGKSTDMEKNIDTLSKYFANDKYDNVAELIQKIWNYYRATVYLYSYHKAPTEEKETEVGMCLILLVYYQYEKQLPIIFKFVKLKNDVISSTGRRRRTAAEVKNRTKDTATDSDEDGMKELVNDLNNVELTEEDAVELSGCIVDFVMDKYLQNVPEDKKEKLRELMTESVTKDYKDYFKQEKSFNNKQDSEDAKKKENKSADTSQEISFFDKLNKRKHHNEYIKKEENKSADTSQEISFFDKLNKRKHHNRNDGDIYKGFKIISKCNKPYRMYTGKISGLNVIWEFVFNNDDEFDDVKTYIKLINDNKKLLNDEFRKGTQIIKNKIHSYDMYDQCTSNESWRNGWIRYTNANEEVYAEVLMHNSRGCKEKHFMQMMLTNGFSVILTEKTLHVNDLRDQYINDTNYKVVS